MKILSITEKLNIGGDEQRLLRFATEAKAMGHSTTVLVLTSRIVGNMGLDDAFASAGIDVRYLDWPDRGFGRDGQRQLKPLGAALVTPGKVAQLARVIRQEQPDVLDLRKHYPMLLGAIAGRMAGVRAIAAIDYHPGLVARGARRQMIKLSGRMIDAFVSDVAVTVQRYGEVCPAIAANGVVIHNGVPSPKKQAARASILAHFGLPDMGARPLAAQVATLVPFKGQHLLLDSIRQLIADGSDAQFILCGRSRSPDYVTALHAKVREANLGDRVGIGEYPGSVDDIWTTTDVHLHAATMDSAPAAIHESMAAGLPLVSTNVGGIGEITVDGETAFLVAPNDTEGLARQAARLLNDPQLRSRMGDAARKRHEAMFTIEQMTRQTLALYERLLSHSSMKAAA